MISESKKLKVPRRLLFGSKLRICFTIAVVVIVAIFIFVMIPPRSTPVITINDGQVQGVVAYSRDGKEYWQFLSIPYAQPPLGKLRFTPPVPVQEWEGVKQTNKYPPYCLQFEAIISQTTFGVEDCLFLNVFTHLLGNTSKVNRPVLVHIHGGGFLSGSSRMYGPDYFMDFEDIVLVTFNYRLGPFGFLNFEHDSTSDNVDLPRGNMGIKDQLLVLKWVQANIGQFGGDPNAVCIYGESAGAASVHLHVLSEQSRGLFHRAISGSGTAFSSWGFTTKPRETANNFVKNLNCSTENNRVLLDCLEKYDPIEIVKFQVSVTDPLLLKDNLSPSVESVIREDTFLHKAPNDIMKSGNFSHVPYMMGVNSGEGSLRTGRFEVLPGRLDAIRTNWTELLGNVLLLDRFPKSVADLARTFYFGSQENFTSLDTQSFLDTLTVLFSDVFAFEPMHRAALAHAKSGAPTYLYYYDYTPCMTPGFYSSFKACTPQDWLPPWEMKIPLVVLGDWINEHVLGGKGAHQYGVTHSEEVLQLWNFMGISKYSNWWELEFSQSFVKAIVDFVLARDEVKFKGVTWPPISCAKDNASDSVDVLPYMLLDNSKKGKLVPEPFASRIEFWNSVGISTFN